MTDYISTIDTAAKWGVTKRWVTVLCNKGRIPGAIIISRGWLIPAESVKPVDARIKSGKYIKNKSVHAGETQYE